MYPMLIRLQSGVPYDSSSHSHLEDMIEISGVRKAGTPLMSGVQPGGWDKLLRQVVVSDDSDGG
jgi:hypothetical protein